MANTNRPFGLRPVRYLNSSPYAGAVTPYYVPSTYGTALFVGDPLIISGTANAASFMEYPIGTLNGVIIAVAGTTNLTIGPIVSVLPLTQASLTHKPANTEAIVMVADDPNLIFEIQDDGGGSLSAATVGLNAVFIAGAGNATSGQSGWMLDGGTTTPPAGTVGFQMKILAAANRLDNDITTDFAVWEVLINQHLYGKNTVGL